MRAFDTQTIRDIIQFEKLSKCSVVDSVFDGDTLYFVVKTKNIYDLIGKDGANIKRISAKVGKNLKVYLYSKDLNRFLSNVFQRKVKRFEVYEEDGRKMIRLFVLSRDKRFIVGQKGNNIKIMGEFLKRQFSITKIDIVELK
ncbi:MAG: NusA-like transcription termination signal-binding factor [Nanohaloarchaea archaeon]|nr:NusA-like transcription termination signal-binding factor [Candidatus Nanohaloarchaea archaeon]